SQARSGAPSAVWRLIGPFGNLVFVNSFANTTTSDVGPLTLGAAGPYTLLLEGAVTDTAAGTYTFNVAPQGNTPPALPTGTPLTLGTTVSDTIAAAGEQDRYIFTLAQPTLLYFDALTNNANLNWALAGPTGTAVSARPFTSSDGFTFFSTPALNL